MKNSKGFGKFESLTVMFGLILVLAVGLYCIINMGNDRKFKVMNTNASKLSEIVGSNESSFYYYREYFLAQALDEGLLDSLKSPFSKGNCDENETKVRYDSPDYYVTIKCGDYLIKDKKSTDQKYSIYKVGKWSDTKTNDNDDEVKLLSCKDCGVDGEYEEPLFVFMYNKANGTAHLYASEITGDIETKTKYRSLTLVEEK